MPGPIIATYDFEDNSLAGFETPAGTAGWSVSDLDANGGSLSARSANIANGETSAIRNTFAVGKGTVTVSFYWRFNDPDAGFDTFNFSIDGSLVTSLSGASGWVQFSTTVNVPADGTMEIEWAVNNASASGDPIGFLDDIQIEQTTEILDFTSAVAAEDGAVSETEILYVDDHAERAFQRLLIHQKPLPRFAAMARAIGKATQIFEDIAFSLLVDTGIDNSFGESLEQWGAIVGEEKGVLEDGDYKRAIKARILVNKSSGDTDDLIAIWATLTAPSVVEVIPIYPLRLQFYASREEPLSDAMVARINLLMEAARPSGIAFTLIETIGAGFYFGFEGNDDALGYDEGELSRIL